jgi:predicted alpha-1,6-mannanase (GH76 family)/lysophospholipase L1-like esterase
MFYIVLTIERIFHCGRRFQETPLKTSPSWLALLAASALMAACGGADDAAGPDATAAAAAVDDLESAAAIAATPPTTVMLLGDSITYGYDGKGTQGGYRTQLYNALRADGLNVDFVGSQSDGPAALADKNHEGHSGWRIAGIAGSVDGWLGTYKPQVVALMIGTNDVVFNDDLANAPARLGRLIDQITAKLPDSRLLVSSITPEGDAALNAKVKAYNAAIPAIVRQKAAAGRKVGFVDMNASVAPANLFDGTHPDATGYGKMALVWRNALLPVLRAGTASLPLNTTKSFQVTTANFTAHVMRHDAGLGVTSPVNAGSAALEKQQATFRIVRGLANPACYSLQSLTAPLGYLRHANSRLRLDTADNSELFRQDATWCARPGVSGQGVSLESFNFPGRFIRHFNDQLWLASGADLNGFDGAGPFVDDVSWKLQQPLAPNVATGGSAEARDDAAMEQLLASFNVRTNGWTKGPTLDAIINTYERTGDPKYRTLIDQSLQYGRGWRSGDSSKVYHDDSGWYANAWLRAYDVTGDEAFLVEAKAIFSDMSKAWDGTCGGGLWWTSEKTYKNAITNELFLLAAARLARRAPNGTGPGSYQDWALKEFDWFVNRSGMVNAQGLVNDGLTTATCKNNGQATWSYNQGVILGGLTELWRLNGDRGYLAHAERIAEATISRMAYADGVLRDACDPNGCGGDALIFKGMFAQGLARLYNADRGNKPQYGDYLNLNADSVWNHSRNAQNGLGVNWAGPVGTPTPSSQAAGALLLGSIALLNAGGETSEPLKPKPGTLSGRHTLLPRSSPGMALDDFGGSTQAGNRIVIWGTNGTGAQAWVLSTDGVSPAGHYRIALAAGAHCLTSGAASGSAATLQPCSGASTQAWKAVAASGGSSSFSPASNPALCLDVASSGTAAGTTVQSWSCNGTAAQQWDLR